MSEQIHTDEFWDPQKLYWVTIKWVRRDGKRVILHDNRIASDKG